jgi:hypothetical protein
MRLTGWAAGVVALGLLAGCGDKGGQARHRVSGSVSFEGQPVPYGDVLITPDDTKKNSGAQAIANIRGGKYDTSAAGGKGYGGGPAVVRVTGLTGEGGKLLCEYEYRVDLPGGDATLDIVVPPEGKPKTGKDI